VVCRHRLIYYRKDLLAKADYDHPPRTWQEWDEQMAAIKRMQGPNRYAVLMPINEFEQQLSLALQQPDPLLRDDDTRGNFASPGFRRTLAFYANMFEQGWAPKMSRRRSPTSGTSSSVASTCSTFPAPGTSASSRSAAEGTGRAVGHGRACRDRMAQGPASPVAPAW
jgi:ABC-type glycerol-3-phosphate transport system substrate-binding protein